MEGLGVVLADEEGLDHGVADAESWCGGVAVEEEGVPEASADGVGAEGQEAADGERVGGEATGGELGLGLLQLSHALAFL